MEKFSEKKQKNENFQQSHSAEKSERDPLGFFNIRSVAKYQNKLKGGPFEDIRKFSKKKSHKAEKREESHSAEKVRTFCFGILVKKLAHTHGFEHEPSGLKSKHLTTRPRTPELCDLQAETRVVARKKSTRTFPQHLLIASVKISGLKLEISISFIELQLRRIKIFDSKIWTIER